MEGEQSNSQVDENEESVFSEKKKTKDKKNPAKKRKTGIEQAGEPRTVPLFFRSDRMPKAESVPVRGKHSRVPTQVCEFV